MIDEEPVIPGWNAPDPADVLFDAQSEPSRRPVQEYMGAIVELRESKGFSFREIAEWISKNAVTTDHNTVYREYKKHQKKEQKRIEMEYGSFEPDPHADEREEETEED